MVARAKWEKFFAIFCNISTKGKRLEVKACPYIPTLHKRFGAGSSGGNVLVPARTLRRSRLRGRCRKAAPLRTPRPHRRKKVIMFRPASGESIEKSLKDTMSLRTSAHAGVAIRFPKAPLADQGWCSAQRIRILMIASGNHTIIYAAPVRTLGLRGSELPSFQAFSTVAPLQSLSHGLA